MGSLKTFIKSVRNSKTVAAERAVIRKESAKIRSSFRDVSIDNEKRRKNLQKLIYLYILGEPTQFGQVECLKLLASPRFMDKRVGYLATMLILDESQDIVTLLTNSLDIDMQSTNPLIVGLALCTLGNLMSPELAKDLYPEVEKLLNSPHAYIKKKAAIVAAKLIEKEPILSEVYIPSVQNLLNEKSHGVLIGTCALIEAIYIHDETSRQELKKAVPKLISHIKLLSTGGYLPEYDVKGIPDPFLFVSLLKCCRVVLKDSNDDSQYVELLNDLLTQVCAKFENTKGAGYAILHETVKTIFAIDLDSSLKVLGINILSKFLVQKENNIRYVALDTLLQVVEYEPLAVQRHRALIVGCLHDGDISIRRRALELTFGIINQQNIKLLTKEVLKYLASEEDEELKRYMTNQLSISVHEHGGNGEWSLETLVSILTIAGNYCTDSILSTVLAMIMQNRNMNLTQKIVVELINALKTSLFDQYGLTLVTIWCIGEYADLIIDKVSEIPESLIITLIDSILEVANYSDNVQKVQIKIYALTACLKLSTKLKKATNIEHLRQIIKTATGDISLEIQTRAVEYLTIFGEPIAVKKGLLERMPAPPIKKQESLTLLDRGQASALTSGNNAKDLSSNQKSQPAASVTDNILLDLLGGDTALSSNHSSTHADKPGKELNIDLLSDIFGSSSIGNGKPKNVAPASASASAPAYAPAVVAEPSSVEAFNDGTIRVGFEEKAVGNGTAELQAIVKNLNTEGLSVSAISVLCAVPKHQQLQLSAISKTTLQAGEFTILKIKITGKEGSKVKIRVKMAYTLAGAKVDKQFDFAGVTKPL